MTNPAFKPNERVISQFIRWIEQPQFDQQHARNWARLYNDNPEAAMCEATFWAVLSDCGVSVRPNTDLSGRKRAPDFECSKDGTKFYVEVTCIQEETATNQTGLEAVPKQDGKARNYDSLNDAIFHECVSKTPQCSNLDAACVLAVGTFHYQASVLAVCDIFIESLLTGERSIGLTFNAEEGRCIGEPYEVTAFRSAAFTRKSGIAGVEHARNPISSVIVAGFGCYPRTVFGALHPSPARGFDPRLLGRIPFCRQKIDWALGTISTEWLGSTGDEGSGARSL